MTPSLRLQVVRVAADQSVSKQGLYFMGQVTLRCAPVEGGFAAAYKPHGYPAAARAILQAAHRKMFGGKRG